LESGGTEMAGPEDFFSPGEWQDAFVVPQGVQQTLEDPRVRAGLTQFGLNMLAGGGWGGSFSGDLARGIGGAGQAIGRQEKMDIDQAELGIKKTGVGQRNRELDIRQQEADSRGEARVAQAEVAGMRGQVAQQNANTATERNQLQRDRDEFNQGILREKLAQSDKLFEVKLRNADQKYNDAIAKNDLAAARLAIQEKDQVTRAKRADQDTLRTQYSSQALEMRRGQNAIGNRLAARRIYAEEMGGLEYLRKPKPPFEKWARENGFADVVPGAGEPGGVDDTTPPPVQGTSPAPASGLRKPTSAELSAAQAAIKGGKDPAAVKKRLQDNGIDPAGL
jgi:hypothetical protein